MACSAVLNLYPVTADPTMNIFYISSTLKRDISEHGIMVLAKSTVSKVSAVNELQTKD